MPKIGMRMIKTAFAVAICLLIYYIRGEQGIPVFSAIAAIICMQPQVENSKIVAFNRIVGTITGAILGVVVRHSIQFFSDVHPLLIYAMISFAVIPAMYITLLLKRNGATAMAAVVLLSVALSTNQYPTEVEAFMRASETIIGIVVSLGVNIIHLPRGRRDEFFFVSGFDGALYDTKYGLTPYSTFELNQLLDDGVKFTIATERTPASLMKDIGGLHLHLPVIAMDGAVLFDVHENRYLACNGLSKELVKRICTYCQQQDLHYFLNVVLQDVLLIYYKDFRNEEEQKLYERARTSPHRNYIYGDAPEDGIVVYFLLVLKTEQADIVEQQIRLLDGAEELLFLRDTSETPPEYCHLKIYHKNATKEYMLRRLLESVDGMGNRTIVAFGSNKNDISMLRWADLSYATAEASSQVRAVCDYRLRKQRGDSIVHTILHLYEPLIWEKIPQRRRKEQGEFSDE